MGTKKGRQMQMTDTYCIPRAGNWMLSWMRSKKYHDDKVSQFVIARIICDETGINPFDRSSYQGREYVVSRQLFFYFMLRYTKKTLREIAKYFNKNHATVIHARTTINNLIETDKKFREMYERLDSKIKKL
jgi:chromosomal replication initiation ATPase DnaA